MKSEVSKTLVIGGPVIIAQLLQMSMNFVDTVMAGNLSAQDLAAIAVGGAIYFPFIMLAAGVLMALTPIVAQLLGARNFQDIGRNARQGLWLSQMLALPIFFLLRNLGVVMGLMDVTPQIIPVALGYLDAISWGVFPLFAYMSLRFFSEGLSITRPGMYFALIGVFVNISANYVFMYGKLGFPEMGAVGCGYASSLVALIMFLCMFTFTATFDSFKRFEIFSIFRMPAWSYLKEALSVGIPIGISSAMEVTMFAVISLLMGTLGTDAVAGHQIAINFSAMTFMVPLGLSTAITARVGNAVGARSFQEARRRGMLGVGMCIIFMCFTATAMFLFPEFITSIYTDNASVQSVAVSLLYIAAIFQISDGLQVGGFGALRGLKDTKIPMFVNLISYWIIGLPLGYYLGIVQQVGPQGLWMGLIAGLSLAGILHNVRFHYLTKPSREPSTQIFR
ncbi:MATE family efflux transporter [Aliifodinibius sp. S!AR15-10]|uniref:MATE family efflux transporter n=1 Tax=Aliifodinibius sp. S!AR15-10 TaxID=2950437 RepID=UPI00286777B3|nr:MATE family efflux transporter [Aliifodinibius sp. S!AR15-10]MDR8394109.1 MATE family efflux transporter [Aliifodinibius sp. S!AR15-10]